MIKTFGQKSAYLKVWKIEINTRYFYKKNLEANCIDRIS